MKKYLILLSLFLLTSCLKNLTEQELKELYNTSVDQKDWDKALECVDEGMRRNPSDTLLYYSKAICLHDKNPKERSNEVIKYLDIHLHKYTNHVQARVLKYITYYDNKQYSLAISEVEKIENLYGIKVQTLLLKANAHFLNKNYKEAAFLYEDILRFELPAVQFKACYYYKIYSKYFSGNTKGALWDTAFLEDYGLSKDDDLLESIDKEILDINKYNNIPVTIDANQFAKDVIPTIGLEYDRLLRPTISEHIYRQSNYTINSLDSLNKDVTVINLNRAKITSLPDSFSRFKKLKHLNLSRTNIKDFDKLFNQLAELDSLEFLKLNYTNLKKFPKSIAKLKNLKGLSIEAANINKLPAEIGLLYNLSYLSIRNNSRIKDLPKEINRLKNLNVLDVSGSGIQRLRNELSLCYNLYGIVANASKIKTIPEDIDNLKLLSRINLGSNKIEKVPESIGNLTYLKSLSLGSNEISELPNTLNSLKSLDFLSLAFNRFQEFPKEVLQIKNLQTLWVHNSNFTTIPVEVAELPKLTHLLIDHELISENNINKIKGYKPGLRVIREDTRKYVKGPKRKK